MGTLAKFLGGAVTGIVSLGLAAWLSTQFEDDRDESESSDDMEED